MGGLGLCQGLDLVSITAIDPSVRIHQSRNAEEEHRLATVQYIIVVIESYLDLKETMAGSSLRMTSA